MVVSGGNFRVRGAVRSGKVFWDEGWGLERVGLNCNYMMLIIAILYE